jgi:hypothetical protein
MTLSVVPKSPTVPLNECETRRPEIVRPTVLDDLSTDIVIRILSLLPTPCAVSLVCRKFQALSIVATSEAIFGRYGVDAKKLSLACGALVDVRCISVLEKYRFPCRALASSNQEQVHNDLSLLLDKNFSLLSNPVDLNRFLSSGLAQTCKSISRFFFREVPSHNNGGIDTVLWDLCRTVGEQISKVAMCLFGGFLENSMKRSQSYGFRDFVADIPDEALRASVALECPENVKTNAWPQNIQSFQPLRQPPSRVPMVLSFYGDDNTRLHPDRLTYKALTLPLNSTNLLNIFWSGRNTGIWMHKFTMIPSCIANFQQVGSLVFHDCTMTALPAEIQSMKAGIVRLEKCPNLESIAPAITKMTRVYSLTIRDCPRLRLKDVEWPRSMVWVLDKDADRALFVQRPQKNIFDEFCSANGIPPEGLDEAIRRVEKAFCDNTSVEKALSDP